MKTQIASVLRWPIQSWPWTIALLLFTTSSTISAQSVDDITEPFTPPDSITVTMYRLIPPGGGITEDECFVDPPDESWGCTWFAQGHYPQIVHPYPYSSNPVTVPIETDYLLDVVPQELGPYYHPTALHAQAIAARSYAYYKTDHGLALNNSSSGNQAFIPYRFEGLSPDAWPANQNDPCASDNLDASQQIVCAAVASGYYVSYGSTENDDSPAFTEFHSDAYGQTATHPDQQTFYPYMLGVQDPVSTACDANDYGHGHGMSQEGASRWAR